MLVIFLQNTLTTASQKLNQIQFALWFVDLFKKNETMMHKTSGNILISDSASKYNL